MVGEQIMTLKDFKIGCEQFTREELLETLYNITNKNIEFEKWVKQQYDDTYTLSILPTSKEKQKEYEIRCKVYEDILDKLKGK